VIPDDADPKRPVWLDRVGRSFWLWLIVSPILVMLAFVGGMVALFFSAEK
jgi:hypothetical protein